jgi:hypothetical protein
MTVTVSFCNQPYPAYFGGYNATLVERTAMALHDLDSLKRNISNHLPVVENSAFIQETVRHYRQAVQRLAQGKWDTTEGTPTERTDYANADLEPDVKAQFADHAFINKQPLCSVWGDAVLLVDDCYYWVSINKCDHTTTAQAILDAVRIAFTSLNIGKEDALVKLPVIPQADVDKALARLQGKPAQPPTPPPATNPPPARVSDGKRIDTSHVPPNGDGKRKSEIKSTEKSAEADYAAALVQLRTLKETGDKKTTIELGEWSNEKRDDYAIEFSGYGIAVDVTKIAHEETKNGTPVWNFYSTYKGEPSQYPMYDCSVFENSKFVPDKVWETLRTIEVQKPVNTRYRVVYRPSRSKDKTTGEMRNYFNIKKIEVVTEDIPPEAMDMTPAQPKGKSAAPGDAIPL